MSEKSSPETTSPRKRRVRRLASALIRKSGVLTAPEAASPTTISANSLREFAPPERPHKSNGKDLGEWVSQLGNEGEKISWAIPHQFDDKRLITGLKTLSAHNRVDPINYIRHSNRFANIDHEGRFEGLTRADDVVEIPQSEDNLHHSGRPRRHEDGRRIQFDYLEETGIDPNFVLYFRVTQPATDGPKPEYYWTSDFNEVTHSLFAEGSANGDPQILISTLADIAHNGGLIQDVNDDEGIAVRQIGLAPFDQQDVLFSFPRYDHM